MTTSTPLPKQVPYVGCHNNTRKPLGTMADKELREARMAVHAKIDPLWRSGRHRRSDVYRRIKILEMDIEL